MNKYQTLFLDIDGTTLRSDHTIEPSTKEAVKQAQAAGIEVFLATGRPIHEIQDIAKSLNINSFIGYNGALAIHDGHTIVDEPISTEVIDFYLQVAKENNDELVFYTSQQNLMTDANKPYMKEFIDYFQLYNFATYHESYRKQILGITIVNLRPEEISKYDIDGHDIYFSKINIDEIKHGYDVIRESVNKGEAVKKVLSYLKLPTEGAVAFGDGMNDKDMLSIVGEGFAMGNADKDLLPYANRQTTSVEESGIYNGLKQLGIVK
ncbi:HAD family hydrolase [Gracilibacillus alcaliphilus]|uniref:HAD family hydrolase n=1 Tax=Gracilibacillus alcaliphilus TaxID=1401441 RepID=UPI001958BB2D|nr:HAD family hydrolase [Gracilibacillus alcaliphilus]MBM7678210.1 Cof subfamily protein (haloacid dehalogenase superfamily) [Gracilibacillus alcaliphilus]